MRKVPTAEEFFEQLIQRGVNNTHSNYLKTAKEFAKLHVKAALEEAAANSRKFSSTPDTVLASYPEENIV